MKHARIVRITSNPVTGTCGAMSLDGVPFSVTLEDYWRFNKPNVSCIPAGQYLCKRYHSKKYPNTFEVTGVEGRSKILFHSGNTEKDTKGCILIGSRYGLLGSRHAILRSKIVFDKFIKALGDDYEFILTITEDY